MTQNPTLRELVQAARFVAGTQEGKVLIEYIKQRSHYMKASFVCGADGKYDPMQAAINDGAKRLCYDIISLIEMPEERIREIEQKQNTESKSKIRK